jgi:hypothetical protein
MNRRSFLAAAAGSTGGVLATRLLAAAPATASTKNNVVTLSGSNSMATYTIPAGGTLRFDPNVSTTLELTGNLINYGRLEMKPARPDVVHTIRFKGVRESSFVGGGLDPLASDVGLWVMGAGVLELQGTPKAAWNRTGTDPSWTPTDEIRVTPTAPGDTGSRGFPTFAGTVPSGPDGHKAEVINLTRNVIIEGTPTGRAHIFIRSTAPQTIRYVRLQHLGPRKNGAVIVGRWCLHFHHSMDGSRGSLVEGVVATACGAHVYVPHMSNGITFRNCIAYNVLESPFWWDPPDSGVDNVAHDILWDSCLAGLVVADGAGKFRITGFSLQAGSRNVIRNCVAVGVQGTGGDASGFAWPSRMTDVWTFEDNIAHNNKGTGAFVWENDHLPHTLSRFVAYRNGISGLRHGAYSNAFHYNNVTMIENGAYALDLHSRSKFGTDGQPLSFTQSVVKGTPKGILITGSVAGGNAPVIINDWQFQSCGTPVEVAHKGRFPGAYEFNRCTVNGQPLQKAHFKLSKVIPGSSIKVDGQRIV